MENAKTVSTPLEPNIKITKEVEPKTEDEKSEMKNRPYRELIAGLIYLANASRPDTAFAASALSRLCVKPGKEYWLIAKGILRYLTSHYGITHENDKEKVEDFTD